MKNHLNCTVVALAASLFLSSQPLSAQVSPEMSPQKVLSAMQLVADWELAHAPTNDPTGWIMAAGDTGFMALAGISGDTKYRDAMLAPVSTTVSTKHIDQVIALTAQDPTLLPDDPEGDYYIAMMDNFTDPVRAQAFIAATSRVQRIALLKRAFKHNNLTIPTDYE